MQEIVIQESLTKPLRRMNGDRSAFPLSYAQQRLWFLDQLEPGSTAYIIPGSMRFKGPLNVAALEDALTEIVRRHEILRTTFRIVNGQPVQSISAPQPFILSRRDLRELSESEREARVEQLLQEDSMQSFDLTRGPLIRAQLLLLAERDHVLIPSMHHIISDGWSLSVFLNELATLYRAFLKGEPSPLAELEVQYADYAVWQRDYLQGEVVDQQLVYWRKQLAGAAPALDFPTDRPRPAIQTMDGGIVRQQVSRELLEQLYAVSRTSGVTLFMTLLAAFKVLLARYSGQSDIVVGSPIAGRVLKETEPLIGNFLNTLVLRTDVSGDPSFKDLVKRVKEVTLEAYANQDVPFEKLVEELQPVRDLSRSPFFQVMFILLNHPALKLDLPDLTLLPSKRETEKVKYDLTLMVVEGEKGLRVEFEYNTELFERATIKRLLGHYEQLLQAIAEDVSSPISRLPLITDNEVNQLTAQNQTTQEYPRDQVTQQLIEAQTAASPDAVAVVCGDQSVTYSELNSRANQLAHYLRSLGVGPDELVGVMVDRSIDMVIGTVAVFKAGGAYVPFDPSFPAERLRFMMEDSGVKVLLTLGAIAAAMPAMLADQLAQQQTRVVSVDEDWATIAQSSSTNPPLCTTPANLAYVIYTSGSTGRPKGVMLEHRSLVNFLCSMQKEPGLTQNDTLLAVTTLSFDIAGLELYLPLVTGARVVIAKRDEVVDSVALQRLLKSSQATVMQATPATWRLLIDAGWMGDRDLKVLCGGEALPRELAEQLVERTGSLWNMYGPTETTIWSSVERVENGREAISLGKPIANTAIYIVDEHGQLVPRCIAGELCIGGEGLARGYFKRAELTAERFVPDPFAKTEAARMYRTGDVARWRTDGKLEYLGRTDHQVKIRGYRIETGEIEAVMAQHAAVGQVVVVARDDFGGDKRLVAYIVPATGSEASLPSTSEWREYLRQQLPEYMVPAVFVSLERLPVTPNGKIDRKQLPAPDERRPELSSSYVPPQNVAEEKIAALWQEALGVEQIGRFDNFFDLGGHSLLMAQVHGRLQTEFRREVSMLDLFRYPTINSLATFLSQEQNEAPQVEQAVVRAGMRLNAVRRPRHIRN